MIYLHLIYFFLWIITFVYSDIECPNAPANPSDRRTNRDIVRLMQYNVE
jgi:hypothetical protein